MDTDKFLINFTVVTYDCSITSNMRIVATETCLATTVTYSRKIVYNIGRRLPI